MFFLMHWGAKFPEAATAPGLLQIHEQVMRRAFARDVRVVTALRPTKKIDRALTDDVADMDLRTAVLCDRNFPEDRHVLDNRRSAERVGIEIRGHMRLGISLQVCDQ